MVDFENFAHKTSFFSLHLLKIFNVRLIVLIFIMISQFSFAQQAEEFRNVKNYYNKYRMMLNKEFQKKFEAEKNVLAKNEIQNDFLLFMKKMDSIENVALIGALLKTKNIEDLKKFDNSPVISYRKDAAKNGEDKEVDYPGGINGLRQEVANLFYTDAIYTEVKDVKAQVVFIVERDGTISNVKAEGDNFTFNRQAEIALYSIGGKFTPAFIDGSPVRSRFRLPLSLKFD